MVKVTVFRKQANVVDGFAAVRVPEFNAWENTQLPTAKYLQFLNSLYVNLVMVCDPHNLYSIANQHIYDILIA
jgi:hypothetical protein